ncbi:hypothetical protein COCMIDRAFT_101218 [Bipolaris oryzae ATCC 44560]|uniref:Uncharacterized protein n=1 Tax=Bipolaris oryzae ATCC 44560 TaxID=930090 RepID=W6Z0V0_COCMI|nr:uncharacterized protein COCMIDRAFT_101218 [Bipolaris oryzae ATCC 44560]EUC43308.1 hypothetical protein COCMIDRAFT_101218 [Bipolaris oryzae ATCC 44560]
MLSSCSNNSPSIPSITITNDQGTSRAISTNTFDAFLPSSHLSTMSDLAAAKQAKKDARNPTILLKKSSKRVSNALKMKIKSVSKSAKKDNKVEEGFKVFKVVKVESKE